MMKSLSTGPAADHGSVLRFTQEFITRASGGKVTVDSMKKLMLGMIGLSSFLAACGSSGSAPDGSGSGRIVSLTTEYSTTTSEPHRFVGCDNITNPTTPNRSGATQVKVEFAAAGSIQSIEVRLVGTSDRTVDPKFTTTIQGSKLKTNAAGNYYAYFNANSTTGELLPAAIVVEEVEQPRKTVTTAGNEVGRFYTDLVIKTNTSTFTITSFNLTQIPVYSNCTIQNTATQLSN